MQILVAGATGKTGLRLIHELKTSGHSPIDDGTRDMRFGDDVDVNGKAARGDVAAVLANAVDDPEWTDTTMLMQSA